MTTYLQRYQNGEYDMVWAELTALGAEIRTNEHLFQDAEAVARATMHRVKWNTKALIQRLRKEQYHFASAHTQYIQPSKHIDTYIQRIERTVGHLPRSIVAFMSVVGTVNLMGSFSGYDERGLMWGQDALPDPLVFTYPPTLFRWAWQEWSTDVADFGIEDVGKFRMEFAPDDYHKHDISGGPPYSLHVPNEGMDAQVEDEWHQTTFVPYLRACFRWGGFPGLARARHPPIERIQQLTDRLVSF